LREAFQAQEPTIPLIDLITRAGTMIGRSISLTEGSKAWAPEGGRA
jgi:hypothetical protein